MKSIRIISVILAIASLCCIFVSCGSNEQTVELPETTLYNITVSFQIKDNTGKTIVDAQDYNYKGIKEPTILNLVEHYLKVVEDIRCSIDKKNNTLQQVGGTKAKSGEYWAFMDGVNHDVQAILSNPALQKKQFIDKKMSEYLIEDGGAFTVVLVKAS